MSKTRLVQVRISDNDYVFIKKMGANFSEIWRIGFEKWISNYPEFLQKKIQEYQTLLFQCNDKMQTCNDVIKTKNEDFEQLKQEYIATGRSIKESTRQDIYWINARCKNKGLSPKKFMEYADIKPK